MKKLLLVILNLIISISAFGQSIGGTNTLISKTNIAYQFNYDYKPRGAFTNTINSQPPTNNPAFKLWFADNTNEFLNISATNNGLYITGSNSLYSPTHILIIQYTNGVPMIWSDNQANGNGNTPLLGNITCPWLLVGTNSYFKGITYGVFAPTNITLAAINVSGNTAASEVSFINPQVGAPGTYEVQCTAVVTQACVGAVMHIGCVASNWSGFITNWMIPDLQLTSLTNRSGNVIVSNVNHPLGYTAYVNNYGSATALGYITFSVKQIQ